METIADREAAQYVEGWENFPPDAKGKILHQLNENSDLAEMRTISELTRCAASGEGRREVEGAVFEKPALIELRRVKGNRRQELSLAGSLADFSKAAVVVPTGGDATRFLVDLHLPSEEILKHNKTTWPVTAIKGKCSLNRISETLISIMEEKGIDIPVFFIVGLRSKVPVKQLFSKYNNFGLKTLFFVEEKKMPVLDDEGRVIVDQRGDAVFSPFSALAALKRKVISRRACPTGRRGEDISVFDYLRLTGRDRILYWHGDIPGIEVKTIYAMLGVKEKFPSLKLIAAGRPKREGLKEKGGTFVKIDGKRIAIVEHHEESEAMRAQHRQFFDRCAETWPGNGSLYLMETHFAEDAITKIRFHVLRNKHLFGVLDKNGNERKGVKIEKFATDLVEFAGRNEGELRLVMVDIEECLSIKNMERLEAVRKNIAANDRRRLQDLGVEIGEGAVIEIHPAYRPGRPLPPPAGRAGPGRFAWSGDIGKNVKVLPGSRLYLGKKASVPDGEVLDDERSIGDD